MSIITPKPFETMVIEIMPYPEGRRRAHKRGITHLVRMTHYAEADPGIDSIRDGVVGRGKITGIFEQEIASEHDGEGIARALRRFGDWMRDKPRKKRKSKKAENVRKAAAQIREGYGDPLLDNPSRA